MDFKFFFNLAFCVVAVLTVFVVEGNAQTRDKARNARKRYNQSMPLVQNQLNTMKKDVTSSNGQFYGNKPISNDFNAQMQQSMAQMRQELQQNLGKMNQDISRNMARINIKNNKQRGKKFQNTDNYMDEDNYQDVDQNTDIINQYNNGDAFFYNGRKMNKKKYNQNMDENMYQDMGQNTDIINQYNNGDGIYYNGKKMNKKEYNQNMEENMDENMNEYVNHKEGRKNGKQKKDTIGTKQVDKNTIFGDNIVLPKRNMNDNNGKKNVIIIKNEDSSNTDGNYRNNRIVAGQDINQNIAKMNGNDAEEVIDKKVGRKSRKKNVIITKDEASNNTDDNYGNNIIVAGQDMNQNIAKMNDNGADEVFDKNVSRKNNRGNKKGVVVMKNHGYIGEITNEFTDNYKATMNK